jgi:hypothetical protein
VTHSTILSLVTLFLVHQTGIWSAFAFVTHSAARALAYAVGVMACGAVAVCVGIVSCGLEGDVAYRAGVGTGLIVFYAGLVLASHNPALALVLVMVQFAMSAAVGHAIKRLERR